MKHEEYNSTNYGNRPHITEVNEMKHLWQELTRKFWLWLDLHEITMREVMYFSEQEVDGD